MALVGIESISPERSNLYRSILPGLVVHYRQELRRRHKNLVPDGLPPVVEQHSQCSSRGDFLIHQFVAMNLQRELDHHFGLAGPYFQVGMIALLLGSVHNAAESAPLGIGLCQVSHQQVGAEWCWKRRSADKSHLGLGNHRSEIPGTTDSRHVHQVPRPQPQIRIRGVHEGGRSFVLYKEKMPLRIKVGDHRLHRDPPASRGFTITHALELGEIHNVAVTHCESGRLKIDALAPRTGQGIVKTAASPESGDVGRSPLKGLANT